LNVGDLQCRVGKGSGGAESAKAAVVELKLLPPVDGVRRCRGGMNPIDGYADRIR
jgi:hypothetical protein